MLTELEFEVPGYETQRCEGGAHLDCEGFSRVHHVYGIDRWTCHCGCHTQPADV